MCPSVDPSTCLLIDLSLYLATHLSIYLSMYLWILRCIDLSFYLSIYFPLHLSPVVLQKPMPAMPLRYFPSSAYGCTIRVGDKTINLSSRHVDNKTMLLDFCWQHQKRSNSARLSHFLQLKTSKTKQFCETFFKNGKLLTVQLTASCQCVLRFFHAMSLKYCACHEKVSPGHTKCCTCHKKASWHSIADDLIRQNATPLRKSAP